MFEGLESLQTVLGVNDDSRMLFYRPRDKRALGAIVSFLRRGTLVETVDPVEGEDIVFDVREVHGRRFAICFYPEETVIFCEKEHGEWMEKQSL